MVYTQGITIDGTQYDVPFVSIKGTADFLDKYAERTEDGDMKLESIGNYLNYQVQIGTINAVGTYKAILNQIRDPVNRFHTVVLPDVGGTFTFYGYFADISFEIDTVLADGAKAKSLAWSMVEKKPNAVGD